MKHPLRFKKSGIEGAPYRQGGFSFSAIQTTKRKPRIVVLGDYVSLHQSSTIAQGSVSYPALLETKLSYAYEIINTSAAFYSLPEEMALLKNKVVFYHPDIIIIGHVFNDLFLGNPRNVTIPLELKSSIRKFTTIIPSAIHYVAMLNQTKRYHQACKRPSGIVSLALADYRDKEKIGLLRKSLDQLRRLKQDKGFRVIFVIIPIFFDFEDKNLNAINEIIIDQCRQYGIEYINLLKVFKKYNLLQVKEDDGDVWHQNGLGNEIIASEIYKTIMGKE